MNLEYCVGCWNCAHAHVSDYHIPAERYYHNMFKFYIAEMTCSYLWSHSSTPHNDPAILRMKSTKLIRHNYVCYSQVYLYTTLMWLGRPAYCHQRGSSPLVYSRVIRVTVRRLNVQGVITIEGVESTLASTISKLWHKKVVCRSSCRSYTLLVHGL